MNFLHYSALFYIILQCCSCKSTFTIIPYASNVGDKEILQKVLSSDKTYGASFIFTSLNESKSNIEYVPDKHRYFYPASTVKLPLAIMALEKLNEFPELTLDTPFNVEGDSTITTLSKEILKIFVVSDNDSANRLFEWLGQEDIERRFKKWGLLQSRIVHRLSVPDAANVNTKKITFYLQNGNSKVFAGKKNTVPLPFKNVKKTAIGTAYYIADNLIPEPLDFSQKNFIGLSDLHQIMKMVVDDRSNVFKISKVMKKFLLDAMQALPVEHGYDPIHFPDNYVKFLVFGDGKLNMNKDIIIHNKVGLAYGFMTDCAYIQDLKSGKSFLLSATIYVNSDNILNDDQYDYDSIGLPFMGALGRAFIEKIRK